MIAEALVSQHENLFKAVAVACEVAANGDVQAAKLVFSAVDQALGKPQERVEQTVPTTLDDLEKMDEASLEASVAQGRESRLRLVEQSEAKPDWRIGSVPSEADASS